MLIATLSTRPIHGQHAGEIGTEIGQYALSVSVDKRVFLGALNKRQFIAQTIAMNLASAIRDTEIPANMWVCQFPEPIAREFSFPATLNMDALNDLPSRPVQ